MEQKILLVGDSRICPQVAYVMDWQDYEQAEQLSNIEKYRDYKIVVCAFKKKSKRLVKIKDRSLVIIYLDDICRELDKDYSFAAQIKSVKPKTKGRIFLKKIITNWLMLKVLSGLRQHISWHRTGYLNKIPPNLLKPSELLLRVIYAMPSTMICDSIEYTLRIDANGDIGCCTTGIMPLVYGNAWAATVVPDNIIRIIKLSFLNGSHCFCNFKRCPTIRSIAVDALSARQQKLRQGVPSELNVAVDLSCNLACPSCRQQHYLASNKEQEQKQILLTEVLNRVKGVERLVIATQGEALYSPLYRAILTADHKIKHVWIISNGTLFNEQNWQLIKDKYERVAVSISVDAATAATYQKLRGADFDQLLKNLEFLATLRKNNLIQRYRITFVVQKDNYREMKDFVKLGKRLQVDNVLFVKLNNWGTFTKREYRQKSLLLPNGCLDRDFYYYLQDPIFQDPIVMFESFNEYLRNSAKRYGEQSETFGRSTDDKKRK